MKINTNCKSDEALEIMLATAKAGKHPGGKLPLGYKVGENGRVVLADDESVELVKYAFKLCLKECTLSEIAEEINNRYFDYNMENSRCWDTKSIKRLLSNPYYMGIQVIGKRRTDAITRQRIYTPKSDWVELNNHHDAIISEIEFTLAQVLLCEENSMVKEFLSTNSAHKIIQQVVRKYIEKSQFKYDFYDVVWTECHRPTSVCKTLQIFDGEYLENELIAQTKKILGLES